MNDLTLIPPFAPPLQGQLVMACFRRAGFLKDMIALFGGIRFHYMDLFDVGEMEFLPNACAETLETLGLHPADSRGEQPYLSVCDLRPIILQLGPPWALISHGTNFSKHSRSWHGPLFPSMGLVHQTPPS